MNEKKKNRNETETLQERLDEIILKKSEQNSALKKLLEELTKDDDLVSSNKITK